MISQAKGLAQQFSTNIKEIKTELIFPWSKLQPGILPIFNWIFKNKFNLSIMPNVVISCGRKSVYTSLFLKRIFKKKVITIHIQNPKINSKNFDYVIAPKHDNYENKNVLHTSGALHQFTQEMIDECSDKININCKNNLVSIIIGGPNRHYDFSNKAVYDLIKKIKFFKKKFNNLNFVVIPSRRTKKVTLEILINELGKIAYVWDKKTINPYLFALKHSKYFILTSDSTSMISECAFTGKPVHIYHLPFKRVSTRIVNFHKEFEEKNITRKLDEKLEDWNYTPLNEAERIAGIIRPRIIQ